MEDRIKRLEDECVSLMRSNLALKRALIELEHDPTTAMEQNRPSIQQMLCEAEVPATAFDRLVVMSLAAGIPDQLRERTSITDAELKRLASLLTKSCGCSARAAVEQVTMWMRAMKVELGAVNTNKVAAISIWKQSPEAASPRLEMSLEELDLSVRAYNSLRRANIFTVSELTKRTEAEILKIRNLGQRSFQEIAGKMATLGLNFREEEVG